MENAGNWIKITRDIRESWIWEDSRYLKWWIDIIMLAGYKDKQIRCGNEIVVLERGSFVTSQMKLAERWNVNRETVKRFLELLKFDNMIDYTTDNRKTVIKVLNYSIYQDCGESEPTTSTSDEHTSNQAPNPTPNPAPNPAQHKKGKKGKNIYIAPGARVIPPSIDDVKRYVAENGFLVDPDEFYRTYEPDWMKDGEPIRDWKSLLRGWNRRLVSEKPKNKFHNFNQRNYSTADYDELERMLLGK